MIHPVKEERGFRLSCTQGARGRIWGQCLGHLRGLSGGQDPQIDDGLTETSRHWRIKGEEEDEARECIQQRMNHM